MFSLIAGIYHVIWRALTVGAVVRADVPDSTGVGGVPVRVISF